MLGLMPQWQSHHQTKKGISIPTEMALLVMWNQSPIVGTSIPSPVENLGHGMLPAWFQRDSSAWPTGSTPWDELRELARLLTIRMKETQLPKWGDCGPKEKNAGVNLEISLLVVWAQKNLRTFPGLFQKFSKTLGFLGLSRAGGNHELISEFCNLIGTFL